MEMISDFKCQFFLQNIRQATFVCLRLYAFLFVFYFLLVRRAKKGNNILKNRSMSYTS